MRSGLPLFLALLALNSILAWNAEHWRFDSIVVHHSATRTGSYESIKAMHVKRGWDDAAYQLILSNGSADLPAGALEPTEHYRDLSPGPATRNQRSNLRGLHLCIIGNYQADEFPEAMRPALGRVLRELCRRFDIPPDRIMFHRDVSASVCPGKHIQKEAMLSWMHGLADQCPREIAAQQDQALASTGLSLHTYPRFLLLVQLACSGVLVLVWLLLRRVARRHSRSNRHSTDLPRRSTPSTRTAARRGEGAVRYPRPR
ncbi:MAG: N-acetylmuramoyl-L-alanine amidase [Desulfovibrio sp.]